MGGGGGEDDGAEAQEPALKQLQAEVKLPKDRCVCGSLPGFKTSAPEDEHWFIFATTRTTCVLQMPYGTTIFSTQRPLTQGNEKHEVSPPVSQELRLMLMLGTVCCVVKIRL